VSQILKNYITNIKGGFVVKTEKVILLSALLGSMINKYSPKKNIRYRIKKPMRGLAPFDYVPNGNAMGYSNEYLRLGSKIIPILIYQSLIVTIQSAFHQGHKDYY
jgi:hypothetical protein